MEKLYLRGTMFIDLGKWEEMGPYLYCGTIYLSKQYGINEQFPAEIEARRRKLYPVMKRA